MAAPRDEGPVYYREIQKNAYLKRIPNDIGGSKLRPLGHKKLALKPMWTLFCVHNGRTPFLEQYPDAASPAAAAHAPSWRASLRTARHVTASVKPHAGEEYDFLVDTDHGPVRMIAPDWESMQDWVSTLRTKLHELKILSKGENVYCAPPAAPPPRAAARDPTSPLPPTPPVPPDRVPGIELTPTIRQSPATVPESQPTTETEPQTGTSAQAAETEDTESIDISNWDTPFSSLPGTSATSQEISRDANEPKKSVAKICGQNICLDDSILKRNATSTDSDEEFFAEIDRIHSSVENLQFDEISDGYGKTDGFTQRLVVNDGGEKAGAENAQSERQNTNITVIQVSNKPPHTAIPVLGPETDVFDFNFKQQLSVKPENNQEHSNSFVNIVHTESGLTENGYGTVFSKESEYGHLSLTTTVNLTGTVKVTDVSVTGDVKVTDVSATGDVKVMDNEGIYERLCNASTSNNDNASPLPVRKVKKMDKLRKSSLPNLDVNSDPTYEYLFPNCSQNRNNNFNTTNITLNSNNHLPDGREEINSNVNVSNTSTDISRNITSTNISRSDSVNAADISRNNATSHNILRNNAKSNDISRNNATNNHVSRNNATNNDVSRNNVTSNDVSRNNTTSNDVTRNNTTSNEVLKNNATSNETRNNIYNDVHNSRVHVNLTNSISVGGNINLNSRVVRTNVERSHSQNAYDSSLRLREHVIRRVQNNSPKREGKSDKTETPQAKPIWKRGLTELSLLSRLRGIGQGRRQESPTRHDSEQSERGGASPAKVAHRSRTEARGDGTRRRSTSLSSGQSPSGSAPVCPSLQPLRARQAAALRAEQRRGAAAAATVPARDPKVFCDYNRQVWIAWWSCGGSRWSGRSGDRVAALRGTPPRDAHHARQLLKTCAAHTVDILFHRVPLGKIYVLNKRDLESIGIKLDGECNITCVEPGSAAARAGLPPPGKWAVTEVNNRPINLIKGGEEEMNRLSAHGSEVSVLIQPSALVKKIRAAIKANKTLLSTR